MELHISVLNKVATYQKRDGDIVCGNSDYTIRFTFDEEWENVDHLQARFVWDDNTYADRDIVDGVCSVPILYNTESVEVGVFGGDLATTTPAIIGCKKSILCRDAELNPDDGKDYANILKESVEAKISYFVPDGTTVYYYDSLDDCIYDVNYGEADKAVPPSPSNVCCWYREDRPHAEPVIVLLQNITTAAKQTVEVSCTLNLAGCLIDADLTDLGTDTSQNLFHIKGEHFRVDASSVGGVIRLRGSNNGSVFYVASSCKDFRVDGGEYLFYPEASNSNDIVFKIYAEKSRIADATIDIEKEASTTTGSKMTACVQVKNSCEIARCNLRVADNGGAAAMAVYCHTFELANIHDNRIDVRSSEGYDAFGIYAQSAGKKLLVGNCNIQADAPDNATADLDGVKHGSACAIVTAAEHVEVKGGTYIGTHSGINFNTASGKTATVFVENIEAYSCGHGGIYFTATTSYVRNSKIGARAYDGVYDADAMSITEAYGDFYVGGNSNMKVYMDNCELLGGGTWCGVLRGGDGLYKYNRLFISNTLNPQDTTTNPATVKKFRIDEGNYLIAGRGTDVTKDSVVGYANSVAPGGALTHTDDEYSECEVYANERTDASLAVNTAAGEFVSIVDAAQKPVRDLRVYGKTFQDGEPSYENPLEIKCVKQGTKVRILGENLFDVEQRMSVAQQYVTATTITNNVIAMSVTAISSSFQQLLIKMPVDNFRGRDVTASFGKVVNSNPTSLTGVFVQVIRNQETVADKILFFNNSYTPQTFFVPADATHMYVILRADQQKNAPVGSTVSLHDFMITSSATDTGAINPSKFTNIELTVPCDLYEDDVWNPLTGVVEKHNAVVAYNGEDTGFLSNGYVSTSGGTIPGDTIVYKLAEPITEQYDKHFITLPHGKANVVQSPTEEFADITIDYAADTKLYIDNRLAAMQAMILEG